MAFDRLTYTGLRDLVAAELRRRIAEGRTTSAAIARRCAIPQGQVHNWLSGRRQLSPVLVDQVLACMRIDLMGLVTEALPDAEAPGRFGPGWMADALDIAVVVGVPSEGGAAAVGAEEVAANVPGGDALDA
jgi:hypothetical protein